MQQVVLPNHKHVIMGYFNIAAARSVQNHQKRMIDIVHTRTTTQQHTRRAMGIAVGPLTNNDTSITRTLSPLKLASDGISMRRTGSPGMYFSPACMIVATFC